MLKVLVVINTFDRWFTLGLILRYLEQTKFKHDILVFDGGSKSKKQLDFVNSLSCQKYLLPSNVYSGNFSCGNTRLNALRYALDKFPEYDFYFMVDDDILFNNQTIENCLSDYQLIQTSGYKIGSYSPFTFLNEGDVLNIGGSYFRKLLRGGEAHVLLPQSVLREVGLIFGPFYKGFGDAHWEKQFEKGYLHIAKVSPVSDIQHIGFGKDGISLKRKYLPFWTKFPYNNPETGNPISMSYFDIRAFSSVVTLQGCENACVAGISGKFFNEAPASAV